MLSAYPSSAPIPAFCVVAAFLVAAAAYFLPRTRHAWEGPVRAFRRLSAPARVLALLLLAAATVVGGGKSGGGLPQQQPPAPPSGGTPEGRALPAATAFSPGDLSRGFVLARVGTNELHAFDPPPGATVCERWLRTGSATGWIPVSPDAADWAFPVGTNLAARFRVFAFGRIDPILPAEPSLPRPSVSTNDWLSPFGSVLGLVPAANAPLLPDAARPSRFWHHFSPSNSLLFTWQNALLDRQTNAPVSFQAELFPSGRFDYRLDLSRIAGTNIPPPAAPDILSGASFGGHAWTTNVLPAPSVTSLSFVPVSPSDLDNPDRDGDGLSTSDEIFLLGTDPDLSDTDLDGVPDGAELSLGTAPLRRDTDGDGLVDGSDPDPLLATSTLDADLDGLPDAYETFWFGDTNATDSAASRDGTGFSLAAKLPAGICPTNPPSVSVPAFTNALYALKLFDGFSLDPSLLPTNLVFERTFAVARASPWQQFFLSSSPTSAAPWEIRGGALQWQDDAGASGSFTRSPPLDSARIPLGSLEAETLVLRLRATSESVVSAPQSLYLLSYAPEIVPSSTSATTVDLASGGHVIVALDGSRDAIGIRVDRSRRPCRAPPCEEETDLSALSGLQEVQDGLFVYYGDAFSGDFAAVRPGVLELPSPAPASPLPAATRAARRASTPGTGTLLAFLSPRVWYEGRSECATQEWVEYDWEGGGYEAEDPYPLDTPCLRRSFRAGAAGSQVCHCEYGVDAGIGDDTTGLVETSGTLEDDKFTGRVIVGGTVVWTGVAWHSCDVGNDCESVSAQFDENGACCDDGCENGNCDALEGPSLGSLRFRIPLGAPRKGQVSGFLWFRAGGPVSVSPSVFSLLARPDSATSDSWSGATRHVVCSDGRGRSLEISPVSGGVLVTVRTTATGALEHTWLVENPGGDPSRVRLLRTSRLGNTMEDSTFAFADGAWTRQNAASGLFESVETLDGVPEGGAKVERRTKRDSSGRFLGSTMTEHSLVGECDSAVLRQTWFEEDTGRNVRWSEAGWWDDPSSQRHGKLRFVRGNDRSWEWRDYDGTGRESVRVGQRDGSPFPDIGLRFSDMTAAQLAARLSALSCPAAFVTRFSYDPLPGDTAAPADFAKPRLEERYVVENGVSTLISRTWRRYTRSGAGFPSRANGGNAQTVPTATEETWRASSQTAAFGDPGNAYSRTAVFDESAEGVPLVARGRTAESLDEDGVLSGTAVSEAAGRVVFETRRSFGGTPFPTYETEELDATHGTLLRRTTRLSATDAIVADETSAYDEKNRLRSTTYLDGTSLTNAYSCCRLLWRRDREGRTVLRSAQTGTDHLYHAMEDVWLADVSTGGAFRVTQRFFDALGRETNTVVRVGSVPGEAVSSAWGCGLSAASSSSAAYPHGGSDTAVRTDERGAVSTSFASVLSNATVRTEILSTNGVEVLRTVATSLLGGPTATRREWQGGGGLQTAASPPAPQQRGGGLQTAEWTETTTLASYLPSGHRVETTVTASSDCGLVTNSVSTYDLLGRLGSTASSGANGAWIATSNAYDGATSRILASTTTSTGLFPRTSTYLYSDTGDPIGTILDGITNRTDTTYEIDASNIVWRVTTSRTVGSSTNAFTVVHERLTGLGDNCRSETESFDLSGKWSRTLSSALSETGWMSTVRESSDAGTVTNILAFGLPVETSDPSGVTFREYDAFGRVLRMSRSALQPNGGSQESVPVEETDYSGAGDVVCRRVWTNELETVSEQFAYDSFGNCILETDPLGNAASRTFDPFGRVLSESGATYPVRFAYDTAGRRTALSTTRDGETWDTTTWSYDHATGLCTNKTYADGSSVSYTYTSDNLPLRTTCATGRWTENVYDARRRRIGTLSGDGESDASFALDEFGQPIVASNSASTVTCAYSATGLATNETWTVGGETASVDREFDGQGRLVRLSIPGSGHDVSYSFTSDGQLESVSNSEFVVTYAYTPDRRDAGCSIALSNDLFFVRSVMRDPFRRELVAAITNAAGGSIIDGLLYGHDALGRPVSRNADAFGYNARGEVVSAFRAADNVEDAYSYDGIGNLLASASGAETNAYAANCLNQYTNILRAPASPRELQYDLDGNLLSDGVLSYAYDSANRLTAVSSNGVAVASFAYDAKSRRVRKTTPTATHTYFYDDWNLVEERIARANGTVSTNRYYWGKDLSGSIQGAGGVGGLLVVSIDDVPHFPCYDHNGNVTHYLDSSGATVAAYVYDAFGRTVAQSGPRGDVFPHRFSTKYFDPETGLYYYGYRFYSPRLMRWLNRDQTEEDGGVNLYCFCLNTALSRVDAFGQASIADYVLSNMGYDRSFPILGPYGLPVPALAARLQIQIYVSGNYAECCKKGKKKKYAKGTIGAEAYLTWGTGPSRRVKGRDRNKPDPYRPGSKMKDHSTDPPDSGYRSRSWHIDGTLQDTSCPEPGLHFSGLTGVIFLRASAGYGVGVQVNIQKEFRAGVDLSEGWSASFSGAWNVQGATIDFGGGGSGAWTYLRD